MKQILAERLLAKVMDWSDDQVKAELRPLLLLAEVKYDEYHQFGPGMRFIERLARWLGQLAGDSPQETAALRDTAFSIVRDHLIFVSSGEMYSLIGMAYSERVLPRQRALAASKAGIPFHRIRRIETSAEFRSLVVKTLYVGLSDGSQIGMLRRMNPKTIDHEFTLLNYDLTADKAQSVRGRLPVSLANQGLPDPDARFEFLVLVDDFTASGTSFIRTEGGNWKGKLVKVISSLQPEMAMAPMVRLENLTIQVLFYVSTQYALDKITAAVATYKSETNCPVEIIVESVHVIPEGAMTVGAGDQRIDDFLKSRFERFKEAVVDEHYLKGDCTAQYRGFNSGDLALVLFHNSPNNSLPVLWYDEDGKNEALFPRTTRHGRK